MTPEKQEFYEFEDFKIDLAEKSLRRGGESVAITPKVYETLLALVENAGRTVEKNELMRRIWPDRFVEESNLTFNIKMLRKALGDNAGSPQFIETVPRRGYRFIAEVGKTTRAAEAAETEAEKQNETSATLQTNVPVGVVKTNFRRLFSFRRLLTIGTVAALLLAAAAGFGFWYQRENDRAASVLSAPFAVEKLSASGRVNISALSPDGRQVAFSSENGKKQSVWLRDLDSASSVEIIPPSDEVYFDLRFSPNGNFIYFVRRPRSDMNQSALYRVSIFGGIPQKILDDALGPTSISPDGTKVSFVRCYYRNDESCSLSIADAATGKNEQKLVTRQKPFRISDNDFSPDGRQIVFAAGQSENQANDFSLNVVDIESGAEREISSEKFFNIKCVAWLPGDKGMLIAASRVPNRHFRLWQISPQNGAAAPLTKDSEDYATFSLDKDAKLMTAVQTKSEFNLFLQKRSPTAARKYLADALNVAFAPNGSIFFSSSMSGNDEIWSMNRDASAQRQLTNDAADDSSPLAAPDGSAIFFASNRSGAVQIWRMNTDGGGQKQVTTANGGFPLAVSPDGNWIYYLHGLDRTLWRAATAGGGEERIFDKPKYRFAVSPDGLYVALSEKKDKARILTVYALADGKTIKKFPTPIENARISEIQWTADGRAIAYVLTNELFENNSLWQQAFDGERPPEKIVELGDDEISSLAPAPDGDGFAVVQGRWKHDAVLIRGLK